MKQPQLGQKILELRKAKGMTQEELVERCNINVRTIQRIEAGEVTPRNYTIRTILSALGYDYSEVSTEAYEDSRPDISLVRPYLKAAFFAGLLYFTVSFVEGLMDYRLWEAGSFADVRYGGWYLAVKITVAASYSIFMFGFYKLTNSYPNTLLRGSALMLLAATVLTLAADIYCYYSADEFLILGIQLSKSMIFGALYIVFGFSILQYRRSHGGLALVTGLMGGVTGFAFLTVILALPGLVLLTLFDILLLTFLFQLFPVTGEKPAGNGASLNALGI